MNFHSHRYHIICNQKRFLVRKMENGVSSNLRSPGGAVRNSSGIFYVLKDLSSYTLSMVVFLLCLVIRRSWKRQKRGQVESRRGSCSSSVLQRIDTGSLRGKYHQKFSPFCSFLSKLLPLPSAVKILPGIYLK